MRFFFVALLGWLPLQQLFAQACIIETGADQTRVKICQHNISIPSELFLNGFCQPRLAGQHTSISFVEQCPEGAFGICRNATTPGVPYQQDIHYYGVSSDARYLQPACEQQNKGSWVAQ